LSTFAHLSEKYRPIAALPDEQRIHFIKAPRWIAYPTAKNVLREMEDLYNYPQQTRMRSLLVTGNPNNGKSSILERFLEQHPPSNLNEDEYQIPVVKIETSQANPKQLYTEILQQFHSPFRPSQPLIELQQQAVDVLRECNVRILMIDEFHSLLTGTPKLQRQVVNEIKYLTNKIKISVIAAGTKEAVQVIQTDSQHSSRFSVISLPNWKMGKEFQQLLLSFERGLPLRKESKLSELEKAKLILSISQGIIGNIHELLKLCATDAIRTGREQIDMSVLSKHRWHTPTQGMRNINV